MIDNAGSSVISPNMDVEFRVHDPEKWLNMLGRYNDFSDFFENTIFVDQNDSIKPSFVVDNVQYEIVNVVDTGICFFRCVAAVGFCEI